MVSKRDYQSMIDCLNYAYNENGELKKELFRCKTELKQFKLKEALENEEKNIQMQMRN